MCGFYSFVASATQLFSSNLTGTTMVYHTLNGSADIELPEIVSVSTRIQ